MKVKVNEDKTVVKIKSDTSYTQDNKLLMKITDTGNGFICYSPSWTCLEQDDYICMDYSQAHYIFVALKALGAEDWD
jgi:hypothetical protein